MIYESDYFVGSALNGDSLSHHGVPNQKWGVRNGPPYPVKSGTPTHYAPGKMTTVTRKTLESAGKIAKKSASAVGNAAKTVAKKTSSSFKKWKESKKEDLITKDTNSTLMKNWQKKQLRISDMSNQELQQRTERKKLEEGYRRALRGDFSDPKTWNKSSKNANSDKGKLAANAILRKFGEAAVDGIAKGITDKVSQSMTAKAKAKVARREARRDAIEKVMTDAAKERAEYKAEQYNEAWKANQEERAANKQARKERRNENREFGRASRRASGDGALDATSYSRNFNAGSYYAPTRSTGIISSSNRGSYYIDPDDYRVR